MRRFGLLLLLATLSAGCSTTGSSKLFSRQAADVPAPPRPTPLVSDDRPTGDIQPVSYTQPARQQTAAPCNT